MIYFMYIKYIIYMCLHINIYTYLICTYVYISPGKVEQIGVMCSSNGRQGMDSGGY